MPPVAEAPPAPAPAAEAPAQPSPRLRQLQSMASLRDDWDCKVPPNLTLSIAVLGASGDLAKKKTFPALFALYEKGFLPRATQIIGYARSELTDAGLRERLAPFLKGDPASVERFLALCVYIQGDYAVGAPGYDRLAAAVGEWEHQPKAPAGRLFYLALPPYVYPQVCGALAAACADLGPAAAAGSWVRVIVEKPFGNDLDSSEALCEQLGALFPESQLYRIDHYLGKELSQNLLVMRWANPIFGAWWNRQYVNNVQISFKEDFGTQGRGGYFDSYGIIRDVIQNHLTQLLALIAMECPVSNHPDDIRDEKAKVLRCIPPVGVSDVVLGQYTAGNGQPGYLEDPTVPPGSKAPTYAACRLFINNERWAGVPFVLRAGKALSERSVVVRIQLHENPVPLFGPHACHTHMRNEFVMRLQPGEAIYAKMVVKKPGLDMDTEMSELDLSYTERYADVNIPDAYERLILDCIRGDQQHFVRRDELRAAWSVFTPLLHAIDAGEVEPEPYAYGSRGPPSQDAFLAASGYKRSARYTWKQARQSTSPRAALAAAMGRVEAVYDEYLARRKGIIRALTNEVDMFFSQCDPERENLCLYGNVDGTWSVDLPAEEVPPEIPEPALGINFARDGMQRKDWLALVAVHSDSWLLALAFYKGARLNKEQREELFGAINSLPTCYEVVSGKAKGAAQPRKVGAAARSKARADDYDDDDEEDDGWQDGEGDPCPGCRGFYRTDEFWIACDKCDSWWCGRCSKMTAAKAEKTKNWCCVKMAESMSRSFSVDDLVGGIFRLQNQAAGGAGMFGRTDSEAAFQEFLKRIPSATNLTASGGGAYEPAALQAQAQQLLASGAGAGAAAAAAGLPEVSGGMPRVPSLDVLRQLVLQNQLSSGLSVVKSEVLPPAVSLAAPAPVPGLPALSAAAEPALPPVDPALAAAAAVAAGSALMVNPAAAAAAAAAIQLQQMHVPLRAPSSSRDRDDKEGGGGGGGGGKDESRRQRRMLSNRESARRSRKRKQEHMQTLEAQLEEVAAEKREKEAAADLAERRARGLEEENARLREDNERLRDELRFLREELTERKERNGGYQRERSSDGEQEAQAARPPPSKRTRASAAAEAAAPAGGGRRGKGSPAAAAKQHAAAQGEGHGDDAAAEGAQQPAGDDTLQ
ncbi:G6PD5 [Scenedesmus sp. PABB004]|nr:G6PD5 [Scenedesmus sp. PABB004]